MVTKEVVEINTIGTFIEKIRMIALKMAYIFNLLNFGIKQELQEVLKFPFEIFWNLELLDF